MAGGLSALHRAAALQVFFEANGVPRVLEVIDGSSGDEYKKAVREKANVGVGGSVGAPMAGSIIEVRQQSWRRGRRCIALAADAGHSDVRASPFGAPGCWIVAAWLVMRTRCTLCRGLMWAACRLFWVLIVHVQLLSAAYMFKGARVNADSMNSGWAMSMPPALTPASLTCRGPTAAADGRPRHYCVS